MAFPVAARQLVGDQPVGRFGIGNAQQRFGEAHEHDAFLRRQRVFLHEGIDAALPPAPGADRGHQLAGKIGDPSRIVRRQGSLGGEPAHERALIGEQLG